MSEDCIRLPRGLPSWKARAFQRLVLADTGRYIHLGSTIEKLILQGQPLLCDVYVALNYSQYRSLCAVWEKVCALPDHEEARVPELVYELNQMNAAK